MFRAFARKNPVDLMAFSKSEQLPSLLRWDIWQRAQESRHLLVCQCTELIKQWQRGVDREF